MAVTPFGVAAECVIIGFREFPGNDACPFLLDIVLMENEADQLGTLQIDRDFTILHIVTQHERTEDHSLFIFRVFPISR